MEVVANVGNISVEASVSNPNTYRVNLDLMMSMEEASALAHAVKEPPSLRRAGKMTFHDDEHSDVCRCDACTRELDDGDL